MCFLVNADDSQFELTQVDSSANELEMASACLYLYMCIGLLFDVI